MNGIPPWGQQVIAQALQKIPHLPFGKVQISFEFNFHEQKLLTIEVSGPTEEVKYHADTL